MSWEHLIERGIEVRDQNEGQPAEDVHIVHQAVISFTLLSNGQLIVRSMGEHGDDALEKWTDAALDAWKQLWRCAQQIAETNDSGGESQ